MKVVALISGGKDSMFNMMHCVANGHTLIALANLYPPHTSTSDELDSHMFQTVGHDCVEYIARCVSGDDNGDDGDGVGSRDGKCLPLFRRPLQRKSVVTGKVYEDSVNAYTCDDEVEDLFLLLKDVKDRIPDIEAVSTGAILSTYQRVRVENVCARLGLTSLTYLWHQDQTTLIQDMIDMNIHAIVIKTASAGMRPDTHLGKPIRDIHGDLIRLRDVYGMNVCGEGGEYETITVDCPVFGYRCVDVGEMRVCVNGVMDDVAPVAFLKLMGMSLREKEYGDHRDRDRDGNGRLKWAPKLRKLMENRIETCVVDIAPCMITAYQHRQWTRLRTPDCDVEHVWSENRVTSLSETRVRRVMTPTVYWNPPFLSISGITAASIPKTDDNINHDNDTDTTRFTPLETQTRAITTYMTRLLAQHGLTPRDVVQVHVHVADMTQFSDLNRVYAEMFHQANPPTRITVQTAFENNNTSTMVQMDCVAVMTHEHGDVDTVNVSIPLFRMDRDTLHVQGFSYWAPANIGPYSQCVRVNDHVFMAGQIGLVPHTMMMPEPTPVSVSVSVPITTTDGVSVDVDRRVYSLVRQTALSLRSLVAVPDAVGATLSTHVVSCIAYVTNRDDVEAVTIAWKHTQRRDDVDTDDVVVCGGDCDVWWDGLCMPVVVVVQRLPRDGLVEWETVVGHAQGRENMIHALDIDDDDEDDDDDYGDGKISRLEMIDTGNVHTTNHTMTTTNGMVKVRSCLRSFGSVYAATSIAMVKGATVVLTEPVLVSVVASVIASIDAVMTEWMCRYSKRGRGGTQWAWSRVFSLRVFHVASVPSSRVIDTVQKCLGRMGILTAVTAVAVAAMSDDGVMACVASASTLAGVFSA